jgi:hypothetical protein
MIKFRKYFVSAEVDKLIAVTKSGEELGLRTRQGLRV